MAFRHGTSTGYAAKRCRCDECRAWARDYYRRRAEGLPPEPRPARVPRHGTRTEYQDFGCRCDACRDAASAYRTAYLSRHPDKRKRYQQAADARRTDEQKAKRNVQAKTRYTRLTPEQKQERRRRNTWIGSDKERETRRAYLARRRNENRANLMALDAADFAAARKRCTNCRTEKPVLDFYRNANTVDGWMGWCKKCCKTARKTHNATPGGRAAKRKRDLFRKFGLTVADYDRLVESQGGLCAACADPLDNDRRAPHVDHCHETGRVRGVLCHGCNTAEGLLRGDPDRVLALAMYLLREADVLGGWILSPR